MPMADRWFWRKSYIVDFKLTVWFLLTDLFDLDWLQEISRAFFMQDFSPLYVATFYICSRTSSEKEWQAAYESWFSLSQLRKSLRSLKSKKTSVNRSNLSRES